MRQKWIWTLVSALIVLILAGCGGSALPVPEETTPGQDQDGAINGATAPRPTTEPAGPGQIDPTPTERNQGKAETPHPKRTATLVVAEDTSLSVTPLEEHDAVTTRPLSPIPVSPALQTLVAAAKADLAQQLSVDANQIALVALDAVVWPDGSLGCPQPDMAYTQVQVEGLLIQFQVDGHLYAYHSGGNHSPFLCKQSKYAEKLTTVPISPTKIVQEDPVKSRNPAPNPSDPALRKLVAQAKEDLAGRLSVSPDQISLVEAELVVWPDGSMGCPQPGMAYIQVQQDGVRIRLSVGQEIYHYHSGGNRPPFLCENPAETGSDSLVPSPGFNN